MGNNYLYCLKCKKKVDKLSFICPNCKSVYSQVTVKYLIKDGIKSIGDLYRYRLPYGLFGKKEFIDCPVIRYGQNIWLKNEGKNKSGSIKEKDIYVGLKVAQYFKFPKCICVSGGSGMKAVKYFQKKGIVHLSLFTSRGDYEETFRLALKEKDSFNVTPGFNPYSQEGGKVISWQLIEDGYYFDAVVVPCGNGTILWGIYKGFEEAYKCGLIKKIPQIIGVELAQGPIGKYLKSKKTYKNKGILHSQAKSIDVKESFNLHKAAIAVKKTKGFMVSVSEDEISESYKKLKLKKIDSSRTAATALAAALKLNKKFPQQKYVGILTSSDN